MRYADIFDVARRDLRGSWRSFSLFMICLALGVAVTSAVGLVNAIVTSTLERDARILLGGDVVMQQSNAAFTRADIEAATAASERITSMVLTNTIARAPDGRTVAVQLKAIDDAYPLLGSALINSPFSLPEALSGGGVLVDPLLLARLDIEIGDEIGLGDGVARIAGTIEREPDRLGHLVGIGPRVLLSDVTLAGLEILKPGALARNSLHLVLTDRTRSDAVAASLRQAFPGAAWTVRNSTQVQPTLARITDRLATYLTLAGLTSLLIGGIGVGLAVRSYLDGKTTSIATLKCLGASSGNIVALYGTQILILSITGTLIGLTIGSLLPMLIWLIPASIVPIDIGYQLHPEPLVTSALYGVLTAILFTIGPLLRAKALPAAALFRSTFTNERRWPSKTEIIAVAIAISLLAIVVIASVPRYEIALIFVAAALVSSLILLGGARLLLKSLAPLTKLRPSVDRLAFADLRRPSAAAISTVIAYGAGLSVLITIALVENNLFREIRDSVPDRAPTMVFIDIQPDQVGTFRDTIAGSEGATVLQSVPMLRARVVEIGGVPVDQVEIGPGSRWTVRHDRGLTYQGAMPIETELVAGEWWPADYSGPALVSVENEVAVDYGVGVGDTLSFNILGRVIEAEIANLRSEIDWSRGRLDFVFVLSPGLIEQAPHTVIAAIDVDDGGEAALLAEMSRNLPNVTPISIGDAIARVSETVAQVAVAVRTVAAITVVAGLLVLVVAILASRRNHIRRTVLLKVLGGRRRDALRMLMIEQLSLGTAAALMAVGIGTVASYLLVTLVMKMSWGFSLVLTGGLVIAAIALALTIATIAVIRVLSVPAATILRTP